MYFSFLCTANLSSPRNYFTRCPAHLKSDLLGKFNERDNSLIEPFDIEGKVIAITGASSGFGHHFAGTLAAKGATTILGARRTDKLEKRVGEITEQGGKAEALPLDVNNSESINTFLDQAYTKYGRVDVLINNAGVEAGRRLTKPQRKKIGITLSTPTSNLWMISKRYTERVLEHKQQSGNIIMVSSITDSRTIKGQFSYAVSKGGMTRMTEVMALEAKFNIRVNALALVIF